MTNEEKAMQIVEREGAGFRKLDEARLKAHQKKYPGVCETIQDLARCPPQIEVHRINDNGRPPDQPGGQHLNTTVNWVNVGGVWFRSKHRHAQKTRELLEELMELGEFTKWEG